MAAEEDPVIQYFDVFRYSGRQRYADHSRAMAHKYYARQLSASSAVMRLYYGTQVVLHISLAEQYESADRILLEVDEALREEAELDSRADSR